jgi:hypothetical protein
LTLYDSSRNILDSIQTGASDYSKWAVGWYRDRDTLVLNSRDIGIYAYSVSKANGLTGLKTTEDIKLQAELIFNQKYKD